MITYNTGRTYDTEQVLKITIEQMQPNDFGIVDFIAVFVDSSRHISGRVYTASITSAENDIGRAVLGAYDAGLYDPV
jgi:hypothetical protein